MKAGEINIITASDLRTGDVVWWTGEGWSRKVDDAVPVGDDAAAIIAGENAKHIVTDTQVIAATLNDGSVRPAHIKDRIRAFGPTVQFGLSTNPADTSAADRVI